MLKDIEEQGITIKRKHTQAVETKVISIIPTAEDYGTDLSKSIFFNKLPSIQEFKDCTKWQKGTYNHNFMQFHKEHTNWKLVKELIEQKGVRDLRLLGKLKTIQDNQIKIAV